MHPQDSVIERARDIARELREHDQAEKAIHELDKLERGTNSMALQALDISKEQIEKAFNRVHNVRNNSYNNLRQLVNAGVRDE
jgi:alcohol dehydrogenase class IV